MKNTISVEEYMNSSVATEQEKKDYKYFMDHLYKKLDEEKAKNKKNKVHYMDMESGLAFTKRVMKLYKGKELACVINHALENYFDYSNIAESTSDKYFAMIKNTDLFGNYSKTHLYFSTMFDHIVLLDFETNTKVNISMMLNSEHTNIVESMIMHMKPISDKPFKVQSPIDKKIKKLLSMKEFILESGSQEVKDKFQKMYDALLLEKEQSNGIK